MSASSKKIVLKKLNSHNTIWHPESTLVFKSQKDRLVIGRYVDDQIIPLDDVALNLCETWNFKPDETLIDDEYNEKVLPEEVTDEEPTDEESKEEDPNENTQEVPTKDEATKEDSTKEVSTKEDSTQVSTKDEATVKKCNSVKSITDVFTFQICEAFDILNEEKSALTIELTDTKAILADLQKKYDDIKKKFDTMKSIFN
jgi:hypothetical protein